MFPDEAVWEPGKHSAVRLCVCAIGQWREVSMCCHLHRLLVTLLWRYCTQLLCAITQHCSSWWKTFCLVHWSVCIVLLRPLACVSEVNNTRFIEPDIHRRIYRLTPWLVFSSTPTLSNPLIINIERDYKKADEEEEGRKVVYLWKLLIHKIYKVDLRMYLDFPHSLVCRGGVMSHSSSMGNFVRI